MLRSNGASGPHTKERPRRLRTTYRVPISPVEVLVAELSEMLAPRRTLIVYRHQYWPKSQQNGARVTAQPYVGHGLFMLRDAGMAAFAYPSQSASVFFAARHHEDLRPFESGLRNAFDGVSADIVNRRIVT